MCRMFLIHFFCIFLHFLERLAFLSAKPRLWVLIARPRFRSQNGFAKNLRHRDVRERSKTETIHSETIHHPSGDNEQWFDWLDLTCVLLQQKIATIKFELLHKSGMPGHDCQVLKLKICCQSIKKIMLKRWKQMYFFLLSCIHLLFLFPGNNVLVFATPSSHPITYLALCLKRTTFLK